MIRTRSSRKNDAQSGMSILQVLIGMGISFLIGVFVLQMLLQMKRVESLMAISEEVQDAEITIQRILLSPLGCSNTLYPKGPIKNDAAFPISLDGIYGDHVFDPNDPNGIILDKPMIPVGKLYATTQNDQNGKFRLDSIKLTNQKTPNDSKVIVPASSVGTLFLQLQFIKTSDANGVASIGGDRIVKNLPISVQVDPSGYIKQCSSIDQTNLLPLICSELGGTINPGTGSKCRLRGSQVIVKTVCDALGMNSDGTKCTP